MTHAEPHPLAGKTVMLNANVKKDPRGIIVPGEIFRVEDWVDRLGEKESWRTAGNWACAHYTKRQRLSGLPDDEEVVYGKIGSLGHCIHNSELGYVK